MFDSQLEAAVPKSGVKVTKDLAYGKDPRQKVDVYQPDGKSNMPILVFFLARFGVVTAGFMWRHFRYAILIIFVIAAVATPSTCRCTRW